MARFDEFTATSDPASQPTSVLDMSYIQQSETRPPRVLIADDQWNVCEALRLLLKAEGYELTFASGPAEVFEHLEAQDYDLLLLDLNYTRDTTSGREGLDLLSQVRQSTPDLPVLVMTAWSNLDIAVEALRLGARDFIQKPWKNDHVLATVRTHAHQHQATAHRSRNWQLQMNEAVQIQRRLLPENMPQPKGCRIAGAYQPAGFLGGDHFDVVETGDETALCIADVSGKGLPAALLMSNLQAALKSQIKQGAGPAAVCRQLNQTLHQATASEKFISFFYGTLSGDGRAFTFCNAGHLPAILVHADGTVERLAEGGSVLGYFDDWDYSQQTVPLPAGSRLLLFTDGVVDACDSNWQEFGEERLIEAAVEHRHLGAEVIKQSILSSVLAHCDGKLQDDATLVVVEVI